MNEARDLQCPVEPENSLLSVFRVPDTPWLLALGFFLVAAGGCFDDKLLNFNFSPAAVHLSFCYGFLALLVVSDREPPMRRRLLATLGAGTLTLLYAGCMAQFAGRWGGILVAQLAVAHSPAACTWLAALWMASPVWLNAPVRRYSPLFRWAVAALCVYGSLCFASAAASFSPANGLRDFTADRAVFLALVFAWLRAAQASPEWRSRSVHGVVWLLGAVTVIGAAIGVVDFFAGPALQEALAERSLIFVESPRAYPFLPTRRLLFPMQDFNRTALFGLCALMVFFLAHFRDNKRGFSLLGLRLSSKWPQILRDPRDRFWPRLVRVGERYGVLCGVPAFFLILFTYTRGAILAAVAGLCLWCAIVSRRMLIVLALAVVVAALCMPAARRDYVLSAFRRSTYKPDPNNMTTMRQRFLAWDWGWKKIAQSPMTALAGLGYGERMTRYQYELYVSKVRTPENQAVLASGHVIKHMHNLWLETAVESGVPAALALLAFCLARWTLLARYFLRVRGPGRRRAAAWIALEFSLMVFGMIFYMLKESYGLLYWMAWACCLSEAEAMARAPTVAEESR